MENGVWWVPIGDAIWTGSGALEGWQARFVGDDGHSTWSLSLTAPGEAPGPANARWRYDEDPLEMEAPAAVRTALSDALAAIDRRALGREVRRRLRPLSHLAVNRALRALTPRFLSAAPNAHGEPSYRPTLAGLLACREAETRTVLGAVLAAFDRLLDTDARARTYGWDDLVLEGVPVAFGSEVVWAASLHDGWEPERWRVPQDVEALAELRSAEAFLGYVRTDASVARAWPTAPLCAPTDDVQEDFGDVSFGLNVGVPSALRAFEKQRRKIEGIFAPFAATRMATQVEDVFGITKMLGATSAVQAAQRALGGFAQVKTAGSLAVSMAPRGWDGLGVINAAALPTVAQLSNDVLGPWNVDAASSLSMAMPANGLLGWASAVSDRHRSLLQMARDTSTLAGLVPRIETVDRALASLGGFTPHALEHEAISLVERYLRLPADPGSATLLVEAAAEVYRDLDAWRALERTPEPSASRDELAQHTSEEMRAVLHMLPADLTKLLIGAHQAARSTNPDRARHVCASLRKFLARALSHFAPHEPVQAWAGFDPGRDLEHGKVTRRARMRYLWSRAGKDAFSKFAVYAVDEADVLLAELNEKTHGFSDCPDVVLEIFCERAQGCVLTLFKLYRAAV
jgi:hypothetical protein